MKKKLLMLALLVLGTGALIWFRVYQMMYFIEPLNGFFYPKYNDSRLIFGIAVVGLILAVFVISKIDKMYPGRTIEKSYVLSGLTAAYGVFATFNALNGLKDISSGLQKVNLVFSFAFTIFIFYYAACLLLRKKIVSGITIIPVLYFGYRLAMHFLNSLGIIKTSEVTLNIVMLVFCALFWHMFGKFISGIKFKTARKWLYFFGIVSVSLCFITSIPPIIIKNFMSGVDYRIFSEEIYFNLATGIYIIIFIICSFSKKSCYRKHYLKEKGLEETEYNQGEY